MNNNLTIRNIRAINKQNILREIVFGDGITRNQLAKLTNVSLMTITNIIDELLSEDLIEEVKSASSIGRTPSLIYIKDNCYATIKLDLSKIKSFSMTVHNLQGDCLFEETIALDTSMSYTDNLTALLFHTKNYITSNPYKYIGIGVSVPGSYFEDTDSVRTKLIPELAKINLKLFIKRVTGQSNIIIAHDVKIAALAEYNRQNVSSLSYLYFGDGLGCCHVTNGNILEGFNKVAGELGQITIPVNNSVIQVEKMTSVTAIEKTLNLKLKDIVVELNKNNEDIKNKLTPFLIHYRTLITNMIWLYNPECIVIGSPDPVFTKYIYEFCNDFFTKEIDVLAESGFHISTSIQCSAYDDYSAVVGLHQAITNNWIKSLSKQLK